jgi:Domain of unknown function (DUF4332)
MAVNQTPAVRLKKWPMQDLPGLVAEDLQKLAAVGIHQTNDLLPHGRSPAQIRQLANQLQVPERFIRKWLVLATLAQLPSVNCQYCGLLLHAGITSVSQLAKGNTHTLHRQILRLQVVTLTRRDLCPHPGLVSEWIRDAQTFLQRGIAP